MACTINNVVILGNWLLNNTPGIRGFPYDANFPDDFGKLGTGRYNGEVPQHRRDLVRHPDGDEPPDRPALRPATGDGRLQTDAGQPQLPRCARRHLPALDALTAGRINRTSVTAPGRESGAPSRVRNGPAGASNGAQLNGIVADFSRGTIELALVPQMPGPVLRWQPGTSCPAGGAHEAPAAATTTSSNNWPGAPGQNNWRWCHKCQGMYFAANPGPVPGRRRPRHDRQRQLQNDLQRLGIVRAIQLALVSQVRGHLFAATQGRLPGRGGQQDPAAATTA